MNKLKAFVIIVFCIVYNGLQGQENFGIKNPGNDYYKKCESCASLITNKPNEIQFGIQKDEKDNLYFIVTHKEWFDRMFKGGTDGIALDIVSKEHYDCSVDKIKNNNGFRGDLQEPIYTKDLKKNLLPSQNGEAVVFLGKTPQKYLDKEVEYNIVFIKNKYVCYYYNAVNLQSYGWDLVDMGFYMDSLTYKSSYDTTKTAKENYLMQYKSLKFEIPFDKNKSEYSPEDIKPLYDSLNLTDFNIQNITIRAYSSIEGDKDRNIKLQQQRAQSIVAALQKYQEPSIKTEILAAENWVDFLNDIAPSKYSYLTTMPKQDIKLKLENKDFARELEPYFKNHRKAVIILELQKKDKYKELPPEKLVSLFNESIINNNFQEAIELQNSIFEKVKQSEASIDLLNKLEIPAKSEFGLLQNKNIMFKYNMNEIEVFETYKQLLALQDLIPKDGKLKYNICSIKFKVWLIGEQAIDPIEFSKEINALSKYGISSKLVKRMLVNYNIIMSEYYMMQGDFVNKDKSLNYIYSNYKNTSLTDSDYLSIAQYFASYAKYDWAIKLIEKRVINIDVDEDLLFYYLNLTLLDSKLVNKSTYRSIMLNAISINPKRYCDIFKSNHTGGASFQLLENDYLRKTYCENCNN